MSRLLYIDCVGGCAGDMLLAALIDAGADSERIAEGIRGLAAGDGAVLELHETRRGALRAAKLSLSWPGAADQPRRSLADVTALIEQSKLPARAAELSLEAFRRLAAAEARVHGIQVDAVHFHEVGALDSIADVCGVALAVCDLGVERVACSPLPVARGVVDSAHGALPLPAPATLELLRDKPVYGVSGDAERVTPTGAALVATLANEFGPLPEMRLERTGYGAGSRELESVPNVVRAIVGAPVEAGLATVSLVETNLDDLPAELVPDAAQACFGAGALDVWSTPVQMKKGRPGVVLSALARPSDERRVAEALLRESSALGVRIARFRRWELDRAERSVDVGGETVRVKVGSLDGEVINVAPEHDDCAAVAARTGRTVKSVWGAALAAAHDEVVRRD